MSRLLGGLVLCCASLAVAAPAAPPLVHGGTHAEVDKLVDQFYREGLAPVFAKQWSQDLLQKFPSDGRAHEVAAFAAMLLGEDDAARAHLMAAAADLDNDGAEVALLLLEREPRAQVEATVRLLDELHRRHPRSSVRTLAAWRLVAAYDRLGRNADAASTLAELAPIRDWLVLGALDNDQGKGFHTAISAEQKVDPSATVQGALAPVGWRKVEALNRHGGVPLADMLWPQESALAYLATWVHSDRARSVQLRVFTGSPLRAYVNDREVLSDELQSGAEYENELATVELVAGWNQVLLKSAHRHGGWFLRARFTDGDGRAVRELRYSSTPQDYTHAEGRPLETLRAVPPIAGPEGRRQVFEHLIARRGGHVRAGLGPVQTLVEAHPTNPIAMWFGAWAYWDNQELGKTIDLLNRGVQQTRVAGFLGLRGYYFKGKQLWERAQDDLERAARTAPGSWRAHTELAALHEKRGWTVDRCRELEDMQRRWPDDAAILRELADCKDDLGYTTEAERLLAAGEKSAPNDAAMWARHLEIARRRNDLPGARKIVAVLRTLEPTRAQWCLDDGELLRRLGDKGGARRAFEQAAHLQPESPRPWDRLAQLSYEADRRAEAIVFWKRAQERDPSNTTLAARLDALAPAPLGFIDRFVPTEGDIENALARKVEPKRGASAARLLDHEVVEVSGDGSARRVITRVTQALDDKGRDVLLHTQLPGGGHFKILRAYAVTERNERLESASIRGADVRFRGLQVGGKTVVQYIQQSSPRKFMASSFYDDFEFQDPLMQIEEATWIVVQPAGRTLHVELTGAIEHTQSSDNGRDVHVFTSTPQAPLVAESRSPPARDLLVHASISNVESWDEFVRWERGLLSDAFVTSPALDALADRLVADAKTPSEKLDRLFHYAAQDVRYQQDYEEVIAGVRPHAAPQVIERGYGDCKDKAVLLIQMAKHVGIAVHFAMLRTQTAGRVKRLVPKQQFNHVIVYVPKQEGFDEPRFLDPTVDGLDVGNLRGDDQGATALVVEPATGKWELRDIPYQGPELVFTRHHVKVQVNSETSATAADELVARGSVGGWLRQAVRNPAQAKKQIDEYAQRYWPGATLSSWQGPDKESTWEPVKVKLDLDGAHTIRSDENRFRLALPGSFALAEMVALTQRETPLHLGVPDSAHYDVDVALPEGYRVAHPPKDVAVEHACFRLMRKAKVDATGRTASVNIDYVRRCPEVKVADYRAFRDTVLAAQQSFNDDLVFEKVPAKPLSKRR